MKPISPPLVTPHVISGRVPRLLLVLAVAATMAIPQAAVPTAAAVSADSGAKIVSQTQVDPQTYDLMVSSPSLKDTQAPVRVQLPPQWYANPDATFPVLFLMHGCCFPDDNRYWLNMTDVGRFLSQKGVITVFPGSGDSGYYSDHWNYGSADKRTNAEAFHTVDLPQILKRGYRADTSRMAVAGLSLAGYGAMEYAADNPGMYKAAASYSGFPDIQAPTVSTLTKLMIMRNHQDPMRLWGDPVLQFPVWTAHNPAAKAAKLKGTKLFVSSGNGQAGPYDPAVVDPRATALEQVMEISSKSFVTKLRLAGVDVTTDFYGPGVHNWPYWEREFHRSWPMLAASLGVPA